MTSIGSFLPVNAWSDGSLKVQKKKKKGSVVKHRKINKQRSVLVMTVADGMKGSLLDAEERVGEQFLANCSRDGRLDALVRDP